MTPEQQAAILWFIERFLHTKYEVQHAKRRAGLEPTPEPKAWNRQKWRFPHLDFQFIAAGEAIAILPHREEAAWAEGIITIDKNKNYQYQTGSLRLSATVESPP